MKVFCDNYDCMFIDEDGFCDCDKLNIVGGVCEGSYHGSRNVTENDVDERLKAENARLRNEWESERDYANQMEAIAKKRQDESAKLRELVKDIEEVADPSLWEFIGRRMSELGVDK